MNVTSDSNRVLISGVEYDTSEFIHPGGHIIQLYSGSTTDATTWFEVCHSLLRSRDRVKTADLIAVESSDQRVPSQCFGYDSDFSKDIRASVISKLDQLKVSSRVLRNDDFTWYWGAQFLIVLCSIILMCTRSSRFLQMLGFVLFSFFSHLLLVHTIHTIGHGTWFSKNSFLLRFRDLFVGSVFVKHWNIIHNQSHHDFPFMSKDREHKHLRDMLFDSDIPFRFRETNAWLLIKEMTVRWLLHLKFHLSWEDGTVLLGFRLLCLAACLMVAIPQASALAQVASFSLAFIFLHTFGFVQTKVVFAYLNHITTVSEDVYVGQKIDWWRYQIETSVNVMPQNSVVSFLSGYSSNQIEHHLFPWMKPELYPLLAETIESVCKKHGVKYESYNSYSSLLRSVFCRLLRMN